MQSRPHARTSLSSSVLIVVPRLAINRPQKFMYVVGSVISCTPLLSPLVSKKGCLLRKHFEASVLGIHTSDGGVQAWLVLSSPTADEGGEVQREPGYLAALVYNSLCPQQAWLNVRSFPPPQCSHPID